MIKTKLLTNHYEIFFNDISGLLISKKISIVAKIPLYSFQFYGLNTEPLSYLDVFFEDISKIKSTIIFEEYNIYTTFPEWFIRGYGL